MQALKFYVESRNKWAAIFGNPQLNLRSVADRQKIADAIDADLSPENLTCDGEVRGAALQAKYQALVKVAQELKAFDPNVTFQEI
jgi:hypothetical protein